MNARRAIAATPAATLLCASGAPMVVGATGDERSLGVTVGQQSSGATLVTVTEGGSPVADATVTVSTASDADEYREEGTFVTDANGTVTLPSPDERVTVEVAVTHDDETLTTTVELVPRSDSLVVDLGQHADGTATVTVTRYGAPVENATVGVVADGTYAGVGNDTTGANGSVVLPVPAETTSVTASTSAGELTVGASDTLHDGNLDVAVGGATEGEPTVRVSRNGSPVGGASVSVEAVGDYAGIGGCETGPNGTVSLSVPDETLSATVVAADGDETAARTVTLESTTGERTSLGMRVPSFVDGLLADDSTGGIGGEVSTWVHADNPGQARSEGRSEGGGPPTHAAKNRDRPGGPANGDDAGATASVNADANVSGDAHPGGAAGERNAGTEDGNGDGAERKVRNEAERTLGIGAIDVYSVTGRARAGVR